MRRERRVSSRQHAVGSLLEPLDCEGADCGDAAVVRVRATNHALEAHAVLQKNGFLLLRLDVGGAVHVVVLRPRREEKRLHMLVSPRPSQVHLING